MSISTYNTTKRIKMKITIIGDGGSALSTFQFKHQPTYHYQITVYNLKNLNVQYEIHLWQCGNNYFMNNKYLRKAFFRNSSASFLVYDITNANWKQSIVKWIEQAYTNDSYLVYAIGTKKDLWEDMSVKNKLQVFRRNSNNGGKYNDNSNINNDKNNDKNNIKVSLYTQNNSQSIRHSYQTQTNQFFQLYQIKNYYQNNNQKITYQIKNIFITINDDRHKLTRSSIMKNIQKSIVNTNTNTNKSNIHKNSNINKNSVIQQYDDNDKSEGEKEKISREYYRNSQRLSKYKESQYYNEDQEQNQQYQKQSEDEEEQY